MGTVEAQSPPPVIELVDVEKVYKTGELEVAALRSVSLRIDEGEFVAIVGPSGSGKSTLMHILGCLDVPTGGIFRLAGHDVQSLDEDTLAASATSSSASCSSSSTCSPTSRPGATSSCRSCTAGSSPAERHERALAALERVGLADRADHRPGELSGGQQQRVAIARALVTEPAMILADEPTGNLDSQSTIEVMSLFDALHAEGATIVLITHERDIAARAEHVVELRDGDIWSPDGSVLERTTR